MTTNLLYMMNSGHLSNQWDYPFFQQQRSAVSNMLSQAVARWDMYLHILVAQRIQKPLLGQSTCTQDTQASNSHHRTKEFHSLQAIDTICTI